MSFEAHDPQALDHWYWLGTQIRCALDPDEPRLLDQYLGEARYLAGWEGVAAWPLFEKAYNLLLDTGRDPILPWHWRSLCLDYAYRPLRTSAIDHQRQPAATTAPALRTNGQAGPGAVDELRSPATRKPR